MTFRAPRENRNYSEKNSTTIKIVRIPISLHPRCGTLMACQVENRQRAAKHLLVWEIKKFFSARHLARERERERQYCSHRARADSQSATYMYVYVCMYVCSSLVGDRSWIEISSAISERATTHSCAKNSIKEFPTINGLKSVLKFNS